MNRISPVLDKLIGIEDPDELMVEISEVVNDTISAPQVGQFFIFSYQPSSELIFIMVIQGHIHFQI